MNKIVKQAEKRMATTWGIDGVATEPQGTITRTLTIKNFPDFMTKSL